MKTLPFSHKEELLIRSFADTMPNFKESTLTVYRRDLLELKNFMAKDLDCASPEDIIQYMYNRDISFSSLRRAFYNLRKFYSYLYAAEEISTNIFALIPPPLLPNSKPREKDNLVLSDDERNLFPSFSIKRNIKSVKDYMREVSKFKQFIQKDLILASKEDAVNYLTNYKNSNSTKRRVYYQLHSFYQYLFDQKIVNENIFNYLKAPEAAIGIQIGRTPQITDIEKLLSTIKEHFSLRDYLFVMLIATTGMKIGQVANLKWSSFIIDANDNIGVIIEEKMTRRYIKIYDFIWELIDSYRLNYLKVDEDFINKDYYLFINNNDLDLYRSQPFLVKGITCAWITKVISAACDKAGIKRFSSKDLRHSHAILALKLGASIKDVQQQLGWCHTNFIYRYHGVLHQIEMPANYYTEHLYREISGGKD